MLLGVIFDLDGVLLDTRDANVVFYRDVMKKAGYPEPDPDEVARYFHLTMRATIEGLTGTSDAAEIDRVHELGRTTPYPDDLATPPFQGPEVTRQLARDYKLGIATSRTRRGLETAFRYYDRDDFSATVGFEDYSRPKPDPQPLLIAADRLGLSPDRAAYVGDHEVDMAAADAAGMKGLLYAPSSTDAAYPAIRTFMEIPAALVHD